jgi:hypothetical protein
MNVQERRRQGPPLAYAPDGSSVRVADEYWNRLRARDPLLICNQTLLSATPEGRLAFRFLGEEVRVDPGARCLLRLNGGRWEKTDDPLLELATVLYLANVRDIYPLGRDIVGPKDLKEGHFFQGPHELKIAPLLERYGRDAGGFREAAARLAGEAVDMADAAFRLKPFPRVHLYYLLWEGDDEYPPRLSVLFDRSIENLLPADAIWGLVTRVSTALLAGKA